MAPPNTHRRILRGLVALLALALTLGATRLARHLDETESAGGALTLFSPAQRGCAIVVPARPIDAERRAAHTLQATLAKASGSTVADFPILNERAGIARPAVFVGDTRRGAGFLRRQTRAPFDVEIGHVVRDGTLIIRSERRESIESAVSWFLEQRLGAHWFMPGPLGEVVPRRPTFTLPAGERRTRPGFVHRDLGTQARAGEVLWLAHNRLEGRFEHAHNLVNVFRPDVLHRFPTIAPMRSGQRFFPVGGEQNWQPNFLDSAAVEHAARAANRAFDANRQRLSFSLSVNDSIRFDDSPATLAAVEPARFFRHRPDYSDLVFGFTNSVAERVAERHPDRWLPAYAYYWCENTPSFRIARNVVPFLTADRSQWSHPAFAAEDRALIERWCRSGAELVGLYDYFYGAPFFSPRPTLYSVRQSIPFAYQAGVRAFFAEASPNWALDGPKPWLTAQLLWSPEADAARLLETYYREFWAEAADPMREFFAICERVWRNQPGPPLWLRFYQDEDQARIYSADDLAALRAQLDRAATLARGDTVRARVAFVSAGLAITEAFAEFGRAREQVHALTQASADPRALFAAWKRYRELRAEFTRRFLGLQRSDPLALGAQNLDVYLRNEPDGRAARELVRTEGGRAVLRDSEYLSEVYLGATESQLSALFARGVESLHDPAWLDVTTRPVGGSATLEWTDASSPWRGSGEPWEGRTVTISAQGDGSRVLRFASCRTEGIGQWVPATPNALYAAQVHVRARTSPGTATFLVVTFLDGNSRHIGLGRADRLPADAGRDQETDLCVVVRAPANARYIGVAVRVLNQIDDDFAEFSKASLRRAPE